MKRIFHLVVPVAACLALTSPAAAQGKPDGGTTTGHTTAAPKATPVDDAATDTETEAESIWKTGRPITMQYYRALDKRGVNVFETTKDPGAKYEGFKLDLGGAFNAELQDFSHRNTASPNMVNGVNTNQLTPIGFGFNN